MQTCTGAWNQKASTAVTGHATPSPILVFVVASCPVCALSAVFWITRPSGLHRSPRTYSTVTIFARTSALTWPRFLLLHSLVLQVLTEISVKAGSIVDSLHVRTNKGQEKKWGGDGGHLQQTWHIPTGSLFLGFHGGVGGHLHSLGVTLAEKGGETDAQARSSGGENLLTSVVKTNLYTADRVMRACGQFLAFNTTAATGGEGDDTAGPDGAGSSAVASSAPENAPLVAPAEVVTALETMRKYADNLLASPLDPKVSRIRLANGFFDRKIGRLPGGGRVIRAMGFELADEGGRMHYVFRRKGAGGGLEELRRARQTLIDLVAGLKPSVA